MQQNNALAKKIIRWFWAIFAIGIVFTFLIFFLIYKGYVGYMPPVEDLENPIDKYASQVISSDNKLLGTYSRQKENRIYVNYNDLSPYLIDALIATEDIRFYRHSGIDAYALARAFVKRGIFSQKNAGGGSTISQQLAKLLFSPKAENLFERSLQKPIEWVIAVQLERYYTKEEIINLYLNKFDFLNNAVGVQSASWVYFGKTPDNLSIEEAATLVGMCKNPAYFNPIRRNEQTKGRRNVVIELMCKNGFITEDEKNEAQSKPLTISYKKVDHKEGLAPYFRDYLKRIMSATKPEKKTYAQYQMQKYSDDSLAWETNPLYGWCNKNQKPDGSNYNLHVDGLKIYTTIDSRMQTYAEEAIREHVGLDLQERFFKEKRGRSYAPFSKYISDKDMETILTRSMKQSDRYKNLKQEGLNDSEIRKIFDKKSEMTVFSWYGPKDTIMTPWDSIRYVKSFLRSGIMSMDARTGAVKAYVGGIDFKYFQYDMVNMGRRQIGSTIKPYLYSMAMEEGMTPCDQVMHEEKFFITETGQRKAVGNNARKSIGGPVTIKWGLQNSDNWVTVELMNRMNPYMFANFLHSFGLRGYIDPVPSLCLGPCDVSIAEMVSGYSAFANRGIRIEPVYVTRIEDSYGNIVATFSPQMQEVISEETSFKMLDMLRAVVDGGTGSRLRFKYGVTAPMGAKTGTTQNHSDGWFMDFTPSLVSGVWVGGEDRDIHFDYMGNGQAASTALPVFANFIKKVYSDTTLGYSQTEQFVVPPEFSNPCGGSSDLPYPTSTIQGENQGIDEFFE